MITNSLGVAGIEVTAIGFGGAPIGNLFAAVDDDTAQAAIDEAWACGIRHFDTAPHYGLGLSEYRLGRALAQYTRAKFVVSTKVGRLLAPNPSPSGSDLAGGGFAVSDELTRREDYSREGVRRSLEASLARLCLDYVDIAYVHDPERHMVEALDHALPALFDLRDEGLVRAIGVATNLVDPLRRFIANTDLDVVMIAGRWTLLDRSAAALLNECRQRGVAVVAAAPFNSGLLADEWPHQDARFGYAPVSSTKLAQARELARRCRDHGASLPQVALQFPLRHRAVASVVVGLRSVSEVQRAVALLAQPVTDELWPLMDLAAV